MALSGNFYSYPKSQFGLYCEWSGTQNTVGNYTDITLNVYLHYYNIDVGARNNSTLSINGVSETYSAPAVKNLTATSWQYKLLKTKTVRVPHDEYGTKTGVILSASWDFNGTYSGTYIGTITTSASVNLDPLDRSLPTVSLTVGNVTSNSVFISANASVPADDWSYSMNGGSSWVWFSSAEGTSVSKTVAGLAPNTVYRMQIRARKKGNGLYGLSPIIEIRTLGASVLNSVNDFAVDAENPSLQLNWTIYEKGYTHTLAIKSGESTIITISGLAGGSGTSNKTVQLTEEQKTAILNSMTETQTMTAVFVLTTYNGSVQIGDPSSFTAAILTTPGNSAPDFTSFSFSDQSEDVVAVTGNNQVLVRSKSDLSITCSAAAAKNGASIVKYRASVGAKSVESNSPTILFGAIPEAGKLTLTVTAIDSRGYATNASEPISVIDYEPIKLTSWQIRRRNNVEDVIQLQFAGEFSPISLDGSPKNAFVSARYRYRKATETTYHDDSELIGVTGSGSGFSFDSEHFAELSSDSPYFVQIEVTDRLSDSIKTLYVNKGRPLVAFRSEKIGININDPQSALDVNGNIRMNGYGVMGFVAALGSETDLNSLTDYGVWTQALNASASTDRHYPEAKAGYLEVFVIPTSYVLQRYTTYDCTGIYVRYKYNGSWSAWKTIILS